jgi:hypothetical protein
MPGSGTLLLVGRGNETRCMRVLKQISFIELSRYCRCKIGTGGHFESPCTSYDKCIITKKDCSASNCRTWRKLKRVDIKVKDARRNI